MKHEPWLESCRAYLQSSVTNHALVVTDDCIPGPVITISRTSGARGNRIATALIRLLEKDREKKKGHPWTLFNENLLQYVIDENHLPERTAEFFNEDSAGAEIRSMVGEILGVNSGIYQTQSKLAETVRRLAMHGNTVIVGRGGNFIAADIKHAVHVRLVGSEAIRARHVSQRDGIDHKQALELIQRIDRGRKRYIKRAFQKNIEDPLGYDFVLNTDHFTDDQAAEIIAHALHQRWS